MTQPISSLVATFVIIRSTRTILKLLVVTIILSSYIFVASCLSPCPPFVSSVFGGYLMVTWIIFLF
jgi:hypothetical protein